MEEDDSLSNDGFEPEKSPSAIDFYDIGELADDNFESTAKDSDDDASSSSECDYRILNGLAYFREGLNIPDRPLASVLPDKYQNAKVHELFPEFRESNVLRFLRLFGPGKESNMPDIWRTIRKNQQERSAKGSVRFLEPLKELDIESDEESKFLRYQDSDVSVLKQETSCAKPLDNSWRFGPARLWYDMVEVPETAETYDYGFSLKNDDSKEGSDCEDSTPGESFLMLSQYAWEDDVIWDGEDVREEVMKNAYSTNKRAGWIPISSDRTMSSFLERCKYISSSHTENPVIIPNINNRVHFNRPSNHDRLEGNASIFPEENFKLLYDRWEDDVIWDSNAMARISYPKEVEIIDSNIILEIPDDDPPPETDNLENVKERKDKKIRSNVKKDKVEEDPCPDIKQDFYNISNDEYYNPKLTQEAALKLNYGGSLIQHSIPSLELRAPYFPTFMGTVKLRRFHRPTLKQYSHGPLAYFDFHGVRSLTKRIRHKDSERKRELKESGGGEMFFMRTTADLSGKDGDLVFFEFSEEHPALMSQVGMASKVRNYYRRRPGKETSVLTYKYGEIAYAHTSPFLGTLFPGQSLQAYENNLFRAPIFEHTVPSTDFIIIRTRYKYYIREVETVFSVGQQLPLIEVPSPKSEKLNSFMKEFLMMFIYRRFWESNDVPRKIKMDIIKKAFPSLREFSIRKRLNLCADFQRTGFDSKFWVLKNGYRLPSEDEIRQLVSPEQCCAYYSMLAAEQRLRDAGYGEKFLHVSEELDTFQNRIDDEVKAAPWNTTQAFISAIRGKSLLELSGVADPTGSGEGFSYVKIPNKPQWSKEDNSLNPTKRVVRGTDADLRRLSLSSAKKLLKSFNVSDREIKSMTRWQIIDVIRTLSTEQAKMGDEGMNKFARGNLNNQAEYLRRYKEECQRIFELQNRILSSAEVLSTDEDSSSEEDSDLEEMGKHIESILSNKKSMKELSHESEEAERKELQKLMSSEGGGDETQKGKLDNDPASDFEGKILRIYRTFRDSNGREFVRVETVRKPEVIQLYTKISQTKDKEYIKNFSLDEEQKEAFRRERRRIQDQLRRIKRNELKSLSKEPPKKKVKIINSQQFKVKCGACGATGHMKTNRACPLYQSSSPYIPPIQVAMTEEQEAEEEKACLNNQNLLNDQNLIKVDETKIIVSKQLIKHADEIRRKSLVLKIPKDAVANAFKRKRGYYDELPFDYVSTPKGINRKRTDPVVSICVFFEKLISELKSLPDTSPFWMPVNAKLVPNYYSIIDKPMDLLTMKEKIRQQKYKSRENFLKDLQQILDNSGKFNGIHSFLSITAHSMVDHCVKRFSEEEEKLMDLEKTINPLLDNDQVAFSFMLETIVTDQLKTVPESWPFHKPVDKRAAKGYYEVVQMPMDLDTIIKNCKCHKYKSRGAFLSDVKLIFTNSEIFNGATSQFTKIAQQIVHSCVISLEMYAEQLEKLEAGIQNLEDEEDHVNTANTPSLPVRKNRPPLKVTFRHTPSLTNGSIDADTFVDVESIGTLKSHSDKGDFESMSDRHDDSNSSFVYSSLNYDLEPSNSFTSPPISKPQSLLPLNGFIDSNTVNDSPNMLSFSQMTCDTICDDLMLSESDSDEEIQPVGVDALRF